MNRGLSLFVLDTNIFIEAHRRYYARDICPGFWECLIHFALAEKLQSIDRVRERDPRARQTCEVGTSDAEGIVRFNHRTTGD